MLSLDCSIQANFKSDNFVFLFKMTDDLKNNHFCILSKCCSAVLVLAYCLTCILLCWVLNLTSFSCMTSEPLTLKGVLPSWASKPIFVLLVVSSQSHMQLTVHSQVREFCRSHCRQKKHSAQVLPSNSQQQQQQHMDKLPLSVMTLWFIFRTCQIAFFHSRSSHVYPHTDMYGIHIWTQMDHPQADLRRE